MDTKSLDQLIRDKAEEELNAEIDAAMKPVEGLLYYEMNHRKDDFGGMTVRQVTEVIRKIVRDRHLADRQQKAVEAFLAEVATFRNHLNALADEAHDA